MLSSYGTAGLRGGLGLSLSLAITTGGTAHIAMAADTSLPATEDLALRAPPINTAPGREYGDDVRIFQGIPGIERARNGRLWAVWYGGGRTEGPDNYVVLVTSGDDGATWSGLKLVIDPPGEVRAFDPCLWLDPSGRLWLFWAQGWSLWDGRAGLWATVTEDADAADPTWSAPRRLCNGIMMNKPTVLSTGEWLLPVAVWNRGPIRVKEEANRHDLGDEVGSNAFVSRNEGATWSLLGQARVPESQCDEHMIVERGDGSLWMLVRTAYGIGESVSTDRGRTWSPGAASGIPHVVARFFIRRLASGRLLLVRHNPPADRKQRSHLTAYLSDDDGKTWRGGLVIDERKGVSYPDGVQSADGTIYIIYDYSRHAEKQILMATFAEEDVLGGAFASDEARARVLVNEATGTAPAD
jgi:predicted neuraminidase